MDMGERISEGLGSRAYLSINGIPFITDAVIVMWIIMAVIILSAVIAVRKFKPVPATGRQNAAEIFVEFVNNLSRSQIGHLGHKFAPYLGTLILFIGFANISAIFNFIPASFGLSIHPPTKNINVTAALAIITLIVVNYAEFRYRGVKGWAKGFFHPSPIYGFVKILDYFVRPLSLCLRLFGNIVGVYIIMSIIYSVMPAFVPAAANIYFELFDGILQAYVFVFLTSLYIGEAVE